VADIPEEDARRLVGMLQGKIPLDRAYVNRWRPDANADPARYQRMQQRLKQICPDLPGTG